jgi:hypothetical protein
VPRAVLGGSRGRKRLTHVNERCVGAPTVSLNECSDATDGCMTELPSVGDRYKVAVENCMNWLAEYFSQKTASLCLSMWAYPPLILGPEGPAVQRVHALPYPGATLVFTPAERVERSGLAYELPARFDLSRGSAARATDFDRPLPASQFFRSVTIFAPSRYNRDFLITVNDEFAFVPVFSSDGAPGFSGVCTEAGDSSIPAQMRLPWTFQGYISI